MPKVYGKVPDSEDSGENEFRIESELFVTSLIKYIS